MGVYADSLLAFKEDIEHKGLLDWIEAHTSFMRPLHRYAGTIEVNKESLTFSGEDEKRHEHYQLTIPRHSITGIHLGFDDVFKRIDDRSLGLFHFVPLRINYNEAKQEKSIYVFASYSRLFRLSDNQKLYEELED